MPNIFCLQFFVKVFESFPARQELMLAKRARLDNNPEVPRRLPNLKDKLKTELDMYHLQMYILYVSDFLYILIWTIMDFHVLSSM